MKAPVPEGVRLSSGRLATGSIFLDVDAKKAMAHTHWHALGNPAAVEMENAGVAQICKAYEVPYLSVRALSDTGEGDANEDFGKFCQAAADNVFPIVEFLVKSYSTEKKEKKGGGKGPAQQEKMSKEEKAAQAAAKDAEKLRAKIIKEGGKKGVEIEGASDMGGLEFFCTTIETPEGDVELLQMAMTAMNAQPDPEAEDRKGCSGHVGKMIFSTSVEQLAIVAYVPAAKKEKIDITEWVQSVLTAVGGTVMMRPPTEAVSPDKGLVVEAAVKADPENNKYSLKDKDTAMAAAFTFLREKGAFPEDDGDESDDMVFGDDDNLDDY